MTVKDVILTIAIMLGVGLVCQLVADFARIPRMLVLLFAGVLLGPSVSDAIDVPLDSMGAQLLLSLGVSFILFHGGLQLSTRVLSGVAVGLTLLAVPGVVLTALIAGSVAAHRLRPAAHVRPAHRRRARADRSRDPDPALRADRTAPEGLADDHRGVRAQRSDGRGARARGRRRRPLGRRVAHAPLQDFVVNLAISTALGVVFGIVLSAAVSSRRAGHLARVGCDRGDGRDLRRVLLHRLGRRQRLSRCVHRRPDRRQHGAARARDALGARARPAHARRQRSPT